MTLLINTQPRVGIAALLATFIPRRECIEFPRDSQQPRTVSALQHGFGKRWHNKWHRRIAHQRRLGQYGSYHGNA